MPKNKVFGQAGGDATIAFITVPLGLSMLLSKEMLIINKYYWKCEEKAERGVQ